MWRSSHVWRCNMKRRMCAPAAVLAVATVLLPGIVLAQGAAAAPYTGPADPAAFMAADVVARELGDALDPSLTNPTAISTALNAVLTADPGLRLRFQKACGLAAASRTDAYPMGGKTATCADVAAQGFASARAGGGGSGSGSGSGSGGGGSGPPLGGGVRLSEEKVSQLTNSHCPPGTQGRIEMRGSQILLNCGNGQAAFVVDADLDAAVLAATSARRGRIEFDYEIQGPDYRAYPEAPPPQERGFVEEHPVWFGVIVAGSTAAVIAGVVALVALNTEIEVVRE